MTAINTMPTESRLLQLPGELRNQIYEHVFDDIVALRMNKRGFLVPPAFAGVCRQIHEEVQASGSLGHSLTHRPCIQRLEAHVIDLDFGHVVQFLASAAKHGIAEVAALHIKVHFTGAMVDEGKVQQWLGCVRCDHVLDDRVAVGQHAVRLVYDIAVRHVRKRGECACETVRQDLKEVWTSRRDKNPRHACASIQLRLSRTHRVWQENRLKGAASRACTRFIRASERANGHSMRFWLERIRQAHLNGRNMGALRHTLQQCGGLQSMLIRGTGAWSFSAERATNEKGGKGEEREREDEEDREAPRTYIRQTGQANSKTGRRDGTKLAERCRALRWQRWIRKAYY